MISDLKGKGLWGKTKGVKFTEEHKRKIGLGVHNFYLELVEIKPALS